MKNTQKRIIVTGAGSGMGKATTLALFRAGYSIALAGRRVKYLQQRLAEKPAGPEGIAVPADVSKPQSVRELFATVMATKMSFIGRG